MWTPVTKPSQVNWTDVPKPSESSVILALEDAQPWGVLIAITSVTSGPITSVISGWTDVQKPTSSIWSLVAKPTN